MTDQYFNMLDEKIEEFGPKTALIWKCGSFYELYDKPNNRYRLREIAEKLNLGVYQKNNQLLMTGWPINYGTDIFVNLLTQLDYNVIIGN